MTISREKNSRKKALLQKIAGEIARCKECRRGKTGLPVPGEGDANARIVFVGMAPGREEAKTGRPFVGRSGRVLTEMLSSIGMDRNRKDSGIYITSPVKYYPGQRNLTAADTGHGAKHLSEQIAAISPRLVVLLGNVAARALLPDERISVSKMHGRLIETGPRVRSGRIPIMYFVTFHPSAAMRFPKTRKLMEADFAKLRKMLKGLEATA